MNGNPLDSAGDGAEPALRPLQPGLEPEEGPPDGGEWLTAVAVCGALVLAAAALFNPVNWLRWQVGPDAPAWLRGLAWSHFVAHGVAFLGACVGAVALVRKPGAVRHPLAITLAGAGAAILISLAVKVALVLQSSTSVGLGAVLTRTLGSHALHATSAALLAVAWWTRTKPEGDTETP